MRTIDLATIPGLLAPSYLGRVPRYVTPERVFFYLCDGPYARTHLYDTVLERDVEYCCEFRHFADNPEFRRQFILEAKVGALGHPHLVPTLDFGMKENGLYQFTRPYRSGEGLQELFESCFEWAAKHQLYPLLAGLDPDCFPSDLVEQSCEFVREVLQSLLAFGFIAVSKAEPMASLSLQPGAVEATQTAKREFDKRLKKIDQNVERGIITNDERDAARQRARWQLFHGQFREVLRANSIELRRFARRHSLVELQLSPFVETVLAACHAVEFAHQRGLWHLHLCPNAIFIGTTRGEVYVKEWLNAHLIADGPAYVRIGVPRSDRDTWNCTPPEWGTSGTRIDQRFDVFALGGILSYLLHETWPGEDTPRRRTIYSSNSSADDGVARADAADLIEALEPICRRAQAPEPNERWPTVGALADAIEGCLKASRAFDASQQLFPAPAEKSPSTEDGLDSLGKSTEEQAELPSISLDDL